MTGPDHYAEAEAHHQAEISMLRADLEPQERDRLAAYALRSATVHALLAAAAAAATSGSMPRPDQEAWRSARVPRSTPTFSPAGLLMLTRRALTVRHRTECLARLVPFSENSGPGLTAASGHFPSSSIRQHH